MNQHIRLVDGDEMEIPGFTIDVAGHHVDLRESVWRLHSSHSGRTAINWTLLDGCDADAILALKLHIIRLIETSSVAHSQNAFRYVGRYLKTTRKHVGFSNQNVTLASLLWYLEQLRATGNGYQFHHIRQWYVNSADRLLDGFNDEVVFALEDLRVEGNAKGFAVLSADPELGPLSQFEEAALRQALLHDKGPIDERAALWLAFAFGSNPANLASLREEDYKAFQFPDDTPSASFLNVPRIKKRQVARTEFKNRNVDGPLAVIIEELIAHNRTLSPNEVTRPLFRAANDRQSLIGGPLAAYARHCTGANITALIAGCVSRMNVISPRTGKPLKVTTRRLRYTFATKMVRLGTSMRELADLLDHSDFQNVQVYYKADSGFVERLDATIAEHIGPTIRAFMGEIVDRGDRTTDLIPYRDLPELGQCGASFVCGLSAPKNCYTCQKFKPFKDGAHGVVLESLVTERTDLLNSGNERVAQMLDLTILAVGEVVSRTRESQA